MRYLIDTNIFIHMETRYHSLDEFADKLATKLGEHYGVADIRELLQ